MWTIADDGLVAMPSFPSMAVVCPLITAPASKLESGRGRPAYGLTEAERRADQALAARSLLEPEIGIRVMSAKDCRVRCRAF